MLYDVQIERLATEIIDQSQRAKCGQTGDIGPKLTELVRHIRECSGLSNLPDDDEALIALHLETGAHVSAALISMRGVVGYILSRSPEGRAVATVVLNNDSAEASGSGGDELEALATAIANAALVKYGSSLN